MTVLGGASCVPGDVMDVLKKASTGEVADALKEALRSETLTVIRARVDPSRYADQFDAIREL